MEKKKKRPENKTQIKQQDIKIQTHEKKPPPLSLKWMVLKLTLKMVRYLSQISSLFYRVEYLKKEIQSPQQKHFVFTKRLFNELYNGCFSVPIFFTSKDSFKFPLSNEQVSNGQL